MEWITEQYCSNDDIMDSLNEAARRAGPDYYLGIVRDEAGLLNVGVLKTGAAADAVQLIPVSGPDELAWQIRVYSEVYGCLAGNLRFDELTPRGKAIVACRSLSYPLGTLSEADYTEAGNVERALILAQDAGVGDATTILLGETLDRSGPDYSALEKRLAGIKYTIIHLEVPTEVVSRILALSKDALKSLSIVKIRLPESEEQ